MSLYGPLFSDWLLETENTKQAQHAEKQRRLVENRQSDNAMLRLCESALLEESKEVPFYFFHNGKMALPIFPFGKVADAAIVNMCLCYVGSNPKKVQRFQPKRLNINIFFKNVAS